MKIFFISIDLFLKILLVFWKKNIYLSDFFKKNNSLEIKFFFALGPMTPPVLDVKVIVAGDDDWLPQPPKVVSDKSKESGEDSTIKALR